VKRRTLTNLALLLSIIALAVIPLMAHSGSAEFAGADGEAEDAVSMVDPRYEVWFEPLFEPASGEIESGLFALQAGLGGVVMGFALGRISTRRRTEAAGDSPADQATAGA
jgi:cobalt/nickel transport protein